MNYTIVAAFPYVERELYLIEIDGKYLMVYKSSGLAGHDSKGNVIPFMYLKEKNDSVSEWGMPFGWLRKYYMEDGKEVSYGSKEISSFPEFLQPILTQLTEDLAAKVVPTDDEPDYKEIEPFRDYVYKINNAFRNIVKDGEFYDGKE